MSIILFIIILGILVVSHEFGHFIVAKFFGMRVEEFGFGFPPRLFGKKFRGTLYSLNLIPFGGFVRIFGEDPMMDHTGTTPSDSFSSKPRIQQAAVVLAGVFFNFILGWGLITVGYLLGQPSSVEGAPLGARIENAMLVVTSVKAGTPAERAGLKVGDELRYLAQGERRAEELTSQSVQTFIAGSGEREIIVGYKRGGSAVVALPVTPVSGIVSDRPAIGIAMDRIGIVHLPLLLAIKEGFFTAVALVQATVEALWTLVSGVFLGTSSLNGVSGPVGMVGLVGDASTLGFVYLLSLMAAISLNLAVMNLVPFPALDGGRLFLIMIEAIRGREMHPRTTRIVNTGGFALLLLLMAILTCSDVVKIMQS